MLNWHGTVEKRVAVAVILHFNLPSVDWASMT
jgi:hypothetical protein